MNNWVLIFVIAILGGYTIAGYARGFLKMIYSLVSWILILVIVTWTSPYIEGYLRNNTKIYEKVSVYCEEHIRETTLKQLEEKKEKDPSLLTENEILSELLEILPIEAIEEFMNETSEAADKYMEEQGVYDTLAENAADLIVKGISFILAFILGGVLSALIQKVLGFLSNLPLIGFANHVCGLAAGAANGLLVVWVGFYLAAVMRATTFGAAVISQIYANEFLLWLYEKNILISILM